MGGVAPGMSGVSERDLEPIFNASGRLDRPRSAVGAGRGVADCGGGNGLGRAVATLPHGDSGWAAGVCLADAAFCTCSVSERTSASGASAFASTREPIFSLKE